MSLAQPAHHDPTTPPGDPAERHAEQMRAIRERTTRGMLLFNGGGVTHLEGDLWAVRSSTLGGFWRVDLADETCDCPDHEHRAEALGTNCKHVYAVAIAHATRRGKDQRSSACQRRASLGASLERAGFAEQQADLAEAAGEADAAEYWRQTADSARRRARRLSSEQG